MRLQRKPNMYGWITCPRCNEKTLIVTNDGHYECFKCSHTDEV